MWRDIARGAAVVFMVGACSEAQPLGPLGGYGDAFRPHGESPVSIAEGTPDAEASREEQERALDQQSENVGGQGAWGDERVSDDPDPIGGASATESGTDHPMGGAASPAQGLVWPIDCLPFETCVNLRFPDTDDDGVAHDCDEPGYQGHQGTDIGITWEQMDQGVLVRAAADGVVFFAADGKFDRCPSDTESDCVRPDRSEPGAQTGTNVCTESGPYCGTGQGNCFWCFAGGNVIVLLHENTPGVFATRYDHLRRGSLLVKPGDFVRAGQAIALVGSAGNSSGPHLHFEVWGTGYYELADPWAGPCGPNQGPSLWQHDPPWQQPVIR